jgi:hypothetical protein
MPSNIGNSEAHVDKCGVRNWRRSDSKRQSRYGGGSECKAEGWGWDWRRSLNESGCKRRGRKLGLVLK